MLRFYKQKIAWRFSYYRKVFKYFLLLKNYKEVLRFYSNNILPEALYLRRGYKLLLADRDSIHIFNEIFLENTYKLTSSYSRRIIVDIGANIGFFSIYASIKNPNATIYAIEPDYRAFTILNRNIEKNKLNERIKTFNLAISSKTGMEKLYIRECTGWSSLFGLEGFKEVINVDTFSFSEFCTENVIKDIDSLKIDTECSEYDIVLKDPNFFRIPIDEIAIEVHRIAIDRKIVLEELIDKLRQYDYRVKLLLRRKDKNHAMLKCKRL